MFQLRGHCCQTASEDDALMIALIKPRRLRYCGRSRGGNDGRKGVFFFLLFSPSLLTFFLLLFPRQRLKGELRLIDIEATAERKRGEDRWCERGSSGRSVCLPFSFSMSPTLLLSVCFSLSLFLTLVVSFSPSPLLSIYLSLFLSLSLIFYHEADDEVKARLRFCLSAILSCLLVCLCLNLFCRVLSVPSSSPPPSQSLSSL